MREQRVTRHDHCVCSKLLFPPSGASLLHAPASHPKRECSEAGFEFLEFCEYLQRNRDSTGVNERIV